jgi:hypothetical protein
LRLGIVRAELVAFLLRFERDSLRLDEQDAIESRVGLDGPEGSRRIGCVPARFVAAAPSSALIGKKPRRPVG